MRIRFAWPLRFLLLGGCGDTLWAGLPRSLRQQGEARLSPMPDGAFARDPLATVGEAEPEGRALRLRLGGRTLHAVLLQETGERWLWRTATGLAIATDGPRVVATSGLAEVLAATRFEGPDPLLSPAALLDRAADARRLVDLMDSDRDPEGMRFGIPVKCRLRAQRLPEDAELLLAVEHCRAERAGSFTNRFWMEAESGTILRAEQWVGPGVPSLTLEFLSPAS
jgi:hypothetical protein